MSEYVTVGDDIERISEEARLMPELFFKNNDVFNYGEKHHFPSPESLAAFSSTAGIGLLRAMALCLKNRWEYYFACEVNKWAAGKKNGRRLGDILLDPELLLSPGNKKKQYLKLDTDDFLKVFASHGEWMAQEGFTIVTFAGTLKQMLLTRSYLEATDSPELAAFIENQQKEIALLGKEESERSEKFWLLKAEWVEHQEELGTVLIDIENRKLENENLKVKWMKIFGGEYITLEEMNNRLRKAKLLRSLIKVNPGMKREELERIAKQKDKEAVERIEDLRQTQRTPLKLFEPMPPGLGGMRISIDDSQEWEKKIIREIWMLTHPDRLKHNPSYDRLTESQRQYLAEAFLRTNAVRSSEVGYHAYQVGWERKSLGALISIRSRIQTVLENAGVDVDPEYVIRGKSLEEKIDFLTRELQFLESGIREAKATLIQTMDNAEVREWRRHLACPEQHEVIKTKFAEMTAGYLKEAESIERELAEIFEREDQQCHAE